MAEPHVDVIIPVHTASRPIARAVASVLAGSTSAIRVNVVCHNVAPPDIAASLGEWARDTRVRLLHHEDGVPSPAGPLNAGYAAATGAFTTLLDSDDEYEPGAVDAWLAVQRRHDADIVIPPLRYANGGSSRTPPTRPGRTRSLDGVRDRLAYRTRQHGLVRRSMFPHLIMTTGLRTGEDVIQGASLWFSNASISLARGAPAYLIHTEGENERTSATPKPAAESLLFLDAVLDPEFIASLSPAQREAFAIKLLRTHVMDIVALALASEQRDQDLSDLAAGARRIADLAPSALSVLSRREYRIIAEVLGGRDPDVLAQEQALLYDFTRPANLLPRSWGRLLHREAPVRFLAATALMR